MRIAVIHNEPVLPAPDSKDVLDEMRLVEEAVKGLGYDCRILTVADRPAAGSGLLRELADYRPAAVFNLVEEWGKDPRRQSLAAALLAADGWAYTGSSYASILTATDKSLAKAVLDAYGLPTPAWQLYRGRPETVGVPAPWIVKPAWEDASNGIDDASVIRDLRRLPGYLGEQYARRGGQPLLLETYIEGREFNLSLLEHPDGRVETLPPAEIVFANWPADKPRIVNYRAKWEPSSFDYRHTMRRFEVEKRLGMELQALALECWRAFGLSGYARVDLRRSAAQELFVIEVNTNPCIAPDAGFMAAAQRAGYAPREVIRLVLETALRRSEADA